MKGNSQPSPGSTESRQDKPKEEYIRHTVIKLTKVKDKDKILKATRGKRQLTYKGTPISLSADFSTETSQKRMAQHI